MAKYTKIVLIVLGVVLLGTALFLIFKNSSTKELGEGVQLVELVLIGEEYTEILDLNNEAGEDKVYQVLLYQNYHFLDKNGGILDIQGASSVKVKYPDRDDFVDTPVNENAVKFLLYPAIFPAEYVFKVEYQGGAVYEARLDMTEQFSRSALKTNTKRFEEDGVEAVAYELEGIDMLDVEAMYHILPNGSIKKINITDDEYFWLKGTDALFGNHEIFVKKDGGWYRFSFLIVSEEDLPRMGNQ